MRFAALDLKLLRDLWRLRGQLVAVALVAACGAATHVTMRGAYEAILEAQQRYYAEYRFADVFATAKRAPRWLAERVAAIPGVAVAESRIASEVMVDIPGFEEPVTALVVSLPERGPPALNDVFVRSGRYLEPGARDEILLGEAFARAHGLKPGDTLVAVLNGRWQRLRIVGLAGSPEFVHVLGGAAIFPDDKRYGVMWMGREGLAASLDMKDAFNSVTLRLAPGADERAVVDALDGLLKPYGGTGAIGRDEQPSHQMLDGEIQQDKVTGIVVPAIFLGVAAFLIYNVLTRLIALQRVQIGVLRAFGYTRGEIGAHYLKLALATVMTGCAAGIGLGAWLGHGLAELYQAFFHFPSLAFHLSGVNLAGTVLVCAAAAVLGAWPAVRRAVMLPPAEAMRPAPPAQFRPLMIERVGYVHLLAPATRMMLRNLERGPLRVVASALAIALASALLVVGQFGLDSLDATIETQFRSARRDDARLAFHEPRGTQARYDLANLPGVTLAEPFRVVSARLRHGHRSKRSVVFGLPPNAELHRIVDVSHREIALPPEGLVLGASLANALGVRAGDTLTLEFLEGRRLVRDLPLVATVEEPIGMFAYMSIASLARLMGEGPSYSDAYLRVDAAQLSAFYAQLKRLPTVSGVTLREASLQSFLDTIAENLLISITVLISFACVIAAGVVYNGARIALSEHAVTLASLRVLGFTRREVAGILLAEQALVTAVAIPLGLLIGYGICAWLAVLLSTDVYRLPLAISVRTYAYAAGVVALAAIVSGALVAWRVRRLDLVEVLKTRE